MKISVRWLLPTLACLLLSVASLFLSILTYVYPDGEKAFFNLIAFIEPSEDLVDILATYTGPYGMNISERVLTVLAALAVLAILAAFAGVITMSMQRPNTWQFIMTLFGIVGTAIPALIVIVAAPVSQQYLPGTFRFGAYPIVTPIAMIACFLQVNWRRRQVMRWKKSDEAVKSGLIQRGGDLDADLPAGGRASPAGAPGVNRCPYCGTPLERGAAFCGVCGKPVNAAVSAAAKPIPTKVCPFCRAPIEAGDTFCVSCGKPLSPAGAPAKTYVPQPAETAPRQESVSASALVRSTGVTQQRGVGFSRGEDL